MPKGWNGEPMNLRQSFPAIAAVIIIAVVLAGEVITVTDSHSDFSSSISLQGDTVEFTIDSKGSHIYDAVSLRNTLGTPESVSVYYDPDYFSTSGDGHASTGARALDEGYYVEQIPDTLMVRGINHVETVDAEGLGRLMSSDGSGRAVIMISGSIPDTVYDGTSDSPILKWIRSGGRLYWAGDVLGKYLAHRDAAEEVGDGTALFLGSDCIDSEKRMGYSVSRDDFRDSLYILNNDISYAPDVSMIPSDTGFLAIGYTDGIRSSLTFVECGEGMVCIMGGDYSIRQRIDMGMMVASGIGPDTEIVETVHGTVSGKITGSIAAGDSVYITLGGFDSVYSENHEVVRCSSTTGDSSAGAWPSRSWSASP